ncbi:hypothetical protein [Pseudobutyrivibrio sp. C4]|uniref:hypothetical protein n=1 Tax=Pseudobutyrivibrio sp. C4 TaxID=1520803 RepID=UPI00115FBCA7|nr:hypothetical protein [Pseudobutyrivibrio sp. C4]
MGFYSLKDNSVDVVFCGTSVTFSAFMPMEAWNDYGIVAYNYCTNVQFENSLKYSLVDIERTQKPQVIMVDIAPFLYSHYAGNQDWDDDNHELFIKYNLDSRKYTLDRFKLVKEINDDMKGDFESYWYYYFDIDRYHTNYVNYNHFNNSEKDITYGYGYLEHNQGGAFSLEDTAIDDGSEQPLNEREQFYLDELIETADTIDAEVVFYCAPVYFRNSTEFGKKNYIKKQIEKSGFKFADFSGDIDEIGLDYTSDFWSINHFDALGAEKVTKHFSEYLVSELGVPDRRKDDRYSYLNDDYKDWLELKSEYELRDLGQAQ